MPLTLSHPAAILPFTRRAELPLSALVIGSMLPDFPYFFPFLPAGAISHSLGGSIVFGLPVGLGSLWLFHFFLKQPLLDLQPPAFRGMLSNRGKRFTFRPWKRFTLICLALLLGIWSHILWDSFTHLDGWFVQRSSTLRLHLVNLWGYQVFVYKLLQHGGTLIGGLLLLFAFASWYLRNRKRTESPVRRYWTGGVGLGVLMLFSALAIGAISGISLALGKPGPAALAILSREAVVLGGSILALEVFVYSLVWRFVNHR